MKKDKSKLNFIGFLGFLILASALTFLGFFIYYIVTNKSVSLNNFNFINFYNDKTGLPYNIIIIVTFSVFGLSYLLSVFGIWFSKWQSKWCRSNKFIFGLLTLLIPVIFPLLFSSVGKRKLRREEEEITRQNAMGQTFYNNQPIRQIPNNSYQQYNNYYPQQNRPFNQPQNSQYPNFPSNQNNPYSQQNN